MPIDSEKTYYRGENVLITSTRAEMAGKTFVMSNITSVSLVEIPPDVGCATLLVVGGVFLILAGFLPGAGAPFLIFGVIVAGLGILANYSMKPQYAVNLSSASGEVKAMQSPDRYIIEKIVAAIKQAVIDSGVQKVETVSSTQPVKPNEDVLQKLQSLKSLLDSGIITAQEYETKKAEILSRM